LYYFRINSRTMAATRMANLLVATYRPKDGRSADLSELLCRHEAALRLQGHLQAERVTRVWLDDDTAIEITDWPDDDSRARAAVDPVVAAAWRAVEAAAASVSRVALS
jgi:hypothetical protein